jgi:L-alanine-DL-glutamate epimerase-like enolase superfamily enzyme
MRIVQIDLWHVSIPLPAPFRPSWIPGFPQTENRFTLVRLRTASGIEGWSAGAAMGRERAGLGALLGPYLLGERADDIPSIRQRVREMGYLGQRVGFLEPACWDIVGKARQKPVYELLGGRGGSLRLYASTGEVRTGPARAREVEARLAEGFSAVKLRVHAATLDEDVAQVRDVRSAVGDAPILGVDANQGWRVAVVADAPHWDFDRALAFCRAAEELGVSWVEEPLAMDDYDGLARLRAATRVDIAGGELNSQGLPEFRVMLEKSCFDVYQPDAMFTGGIAETWRILQRVQRAGARYTPHTWTHGLGFAVNAQIQAASPWRDETLLEFPFDPPGWVPSARDGILEVPFDHRNGLLELPTAPGLGFAISRRALQRYGTHFYRATRLRMAMFAVWDKGFAVAKELGATRDARLAERHRVIEAASTDGVDVAASALVESSAGDGG